MRLIDAAMPHGEIVVKDLAALVTALQELTMRIGRDVVTTTGPGRTKQFMEEFAQLRLRGVTPGSTVLTFSKGPTGRLDIDLADQETADTRFWQIVAAIGEDRRPEWASDLVAESVGKLVTALRDAAPRATLSDSAHPAVEIDSSRIRVETWTSGRVVTDTPMEARGRLEKIDLRSHEFRVRDDVGLSVDLKHVADDAHAAQFVGQWVVATGEGVLAADSRLVALNNAVVELVHDPVRDLVDDNSLTIEQLLASAPGPDHRDGIDLTDEEFASFLEAARG
ncbi:MAG: hypothetical protein LBQ06_07535 [Frankiaceae bacterium]|nr:hypothetical protein [Frankiaceae bacterium]